jgi:hypothetical protein
MTFAGVLLLLAALATLRIRAREDGTEVETPVVAGH